MEIAVGINSNGLVITQEELHVGSLTGLKVLALAALFRLDIDPLDKVLGDHGVIHSANIYSNYAVLHGDGRKMLLIACIHGVGLQIGHLLAAAKQRDAGVVDLAHQIAAVLADIKLCHSCILLISALCAGCLLY